MKEKYLVKEIMIEIEALKNNFEIVRLVNPSINKSYKLSEDGKSFINSGYECYATWRGGKRCDNCISSKVLENKARQSKFEFVNEKVYIVFARYVDVEGKKLVLELITKAEDDVILSSFGTNEFINKITEYNKKISIDDLTGVYNRKYLMERLGVYLEEYLHHGKDTAVIMLDIDFFKEINDRYGHLIGDKALVTLSQILKNVLKESRGEFISRFGGDEFILVLANTDRERLRRRINRIAKAARELSIEGHDDIKISLSMGGVCYSELDNPTLEELLNKADKRLYRAKKMGRNLTVLDN